MTRRWFRVLPAIALLLPTVAWSAALTLGSHLGLASIQSDVRGSGRSTSVAWPSSVITYQPGLRVGLADDHHTHALFVDTGMLNLDEGGSTLNMVVVQFSYEFAFRADRTTAPTASFGAGFYHEGSAAYASTSPGYGGGLGVRHRIRGDHGAVRAEVRADYLRSSDAFGRPRLTTVGLRLGFDLWL